MISLDPTITLGALINAAAIIIGFVVAFTRIGGRLDLHTERIKRLEESIREARDVDSRLATQEERLNSHARDIHDLRRGKGFIQRDSRGGTDGEYP